MSKIIETTKPPYYAVIFTSIKTSTDNGYEKISDNLVDIVSKQK